MNEFEEEFMRNYKCSKYGMNKVIQNHKHYSIFYHAFEKEYFSPHFSHLSCIPDAGLVSPHKPQ